MEKLEERKRSFNIDKLSPEAADQIGRDLGDKVKAYCDEAVEKANKILNVYGMKAQMQIVIKGINEDFTKTPLETPKKKRGRPRKATNL